MFSFVAEYLALVILGVIIAVVGRRKYLNTHDQYRFFASVILAIVSIVIDSLCVFTLEHSHELPLWVNYIDNAAYYIVCFVMVSSFTDYVFSFMLRRSGRRRFLAIAGHLNHYVCLLCVVLTLFNPITQWMFYIAADFTYIHGPLWVIGYAQVVLMLLLSGLCTALYRREVSRAMMRVVSISVPALAALIGFQLAYPGTMMNGIMAAIFSLILLLVLQSSSIETDALTGLGNRFAFVAAAGTWTEMRHPKRILVLLVHGLEDINSTYGMDAGDRVIIDIAEHAREICAGGDVFRINATSIALAFSHRENRTGEEIAAFVNANLPNEIIVEGDKLRIQMSVIDYAANMVGGAPKVVERIEYARDEARRNRLSFIRVDDALISEVESKKRLTRYLEESVDLNRFEVWLQPVYNVKDSCLCSAEALVRLKGPKGDFIPPAQFVGIAEDSALIMAIGEQIIRKLCAFVQSHPALPLKMISINLSLRQLSDSRFPDLLDGAIDSAGISRNLIALEITERMFAADDRVAATLAELVKRGYRFLMDDFGTGFSNFASMLDFPFSFIKLDRILLAAAQEDGYDTIRTLTRLFHHGGYEVVIEGVETAEQARQVIDCGVDYIQGFYYARPMPLYQVPEFLNETDFSCRVTVVKHYGMKALR